MRLGQIRRLQYWLEYFFTWQEDGEDADARKENRKTWKPIIESLCAGMDKLDNATYIKTPFIKNKTLEQIEVECFGYEISHLLLRGYAPGKYICSCHICEKQFGGDKRCMICTHCAAQRPLNLS